MLNMKFCVWTWQFEGENGDRMKTAYGHLCCHQKEAVSVYKDLQKTERKFQQFIKVSHQCIYFCTKEVTTENDFYNTLKSS